MLYPHGLSQWGCTGAKGGQSDLFAENWRNGQNWCSQLTGVASLVDSERKSLQRMLSECDAVNNCAFSVA